MKKILIAAVLALVTVLACSQNPTAGSSAPKFTTEQKKQIIRFMTLSQEIQNLPQVKERDKLNDEISKLPQVVEQTKLQPEIIKFVGEVCKQPNWTYSPNVPNAEGTGTEPGCIAVPPQAQPKK